jgi:hypothetical protein
MRRPHARLPVASTTKIMTALLALERLRPTRAVTVARAATRVPLVREGLRPGERVQAWKLFYGLLLYSGNDDALALAIASAGSRPAFVRLMNAEAHRLGMIDTHFSSERRRRQGQLLERLGHGGAHPLRPAQRTLPHDRPHPPQARALERADLREDLREQEPPAEGLPRR